MQGVGGVGGRSPDFDLPADGPEAVSLPRSGWKDEDALGKAVGDAKASVDASRSRPNHRTKWVDAKNDRVTNTKAETMPAFVALSGKRGTAKMNPSKPVIAAKYGLAPGTGGTGGTTPTKPVIVAKYGLAPGTGGTGGTKPTKPVIVAKYGLAPSRPGGGGTPTKPVVVAKYGVPSHGGGGTPPKPVIVAKYGVPSHRGNR